MPLTLIEYTHSLPDLEEILASRQLRKVVRSRHLAQLGDLLTNFIYSAVRIGMKGGNGAIHVWDMSLGDAIRAADLRKYFPNRMKRDELADGAEALIGYAYFSEVMSLDEMIKILSEWINAEDIKFHVIEKKAATTAFQILLEKILTRCQTLDRFDDISEQ